MVYKWYILPIGWLYITYHLVREPETAIDLRIDASAIITPLSVQRLVLQFMRFGWMFDVFDVFVLGGSAITTPSPMVVDMVWSSWNLLNFLWCSTGFNNIPHDLPDILPIYSTVGKKVRARIRTQLEEICEFDHTVGRRNYFLVAISDSSSDWLYTSCW